MPVSEIVNWKQFVKGGKFKAHSRKGQIIHKEQYTLDSQEKLATYDTQNASKTKTK